VQNEDLGKIHSTPALRYQADFHNEFRWLTWDLLCGMIDREHPLWDYLTTNGATEAELDWFRDVQCHPDIIGVDHYVSSERFIDEHTDRYPEHGQNDNGRHTYVDVVAARVLAEGLAGPKTLVREAWDRYHRPLAITEAHNFCTREEQMRWFLEMWDAATELKQEGVDIRAVTAWSVFGAHGWDRLCLEPGGTYEVGVFDTSVSPPRPTAMVPMLKSLAEGRRPDHPLLQIPGWWKRDCRLIHGHSIDSNGNLRLPLQPGDLMVETVYRVAPLLIAGEASLLRDALTDHCDLRGIPYKLADTMEPTTDGIEWTLDNVKPWAVAILPDAPVDRLIAETCAARSLPVTDLSEEQTTGLVTGSISALSPDLTSALNAALDELIDRSLVVLPSIAERAIRAPAAAAH
jgi:dTDP-4-dehydrorhamnose reductase